MVTKKFVSHTPYFTYSTGIWADYKLHATSNKCRKKRLLTLGLARNKNGNQNDTDIRDGIRVGPNVEITYIKPDCALPDLQRPLEHFEHITDVKLTVNHLVTLSEQMELNLYVNFSRFFCLVLPEQMLFFTTYLIGTNAF